MNFHLPYKTLKVSQQHVRRLQSLGDSAASDTPDSRYLSQKKKCWIPADAQQSFISAVGNDLIKTSELWVPRPWATLKYYRRPFRCRNRVMNWNIELETKSFRILPLTYGTKYDTT